MSTPYIYHYGNFSSNVTPTPTACAWCKDTCDTNNPVVSVFVSGLAVLICECCWKMVEEYANDFPQERNSKIAEIGNLKNLLTFAARYVQVCLEGGDWDIVDSSPTISADTLMRIRKALGLPDTHDFTKR